MSDIPTEVPEGFEAYEVRHPGPRVVHYIVQPGDNLTKIAREYGTTVAEMKSLNIGIADLNLIFPGQLIHVLDNILP